MADEHIAVTPGVRRQPSLRRTLVMAALAGVVGFLLSMATYSPGGWNDLDVLTRGSWTWWAGYNPYHVSLYFYPFTGTLALLPIAWLPAIFARAAFAAFSMALLTLAILRTGPYRWPILLCFPLLACLQHGQWSAILLAAFLWPPLGGLLAIKPNFALPLLLWRPTWRHLLPAIVGGGASVTISLAIWPGWPLEWLAALRDSSAWYRPLLLSPLGGPLIALALLRWRDPDARMLFGLAAIPQTIWLYNAAPVLLVARTERQAVLLCCLGWLAQPMSDLARMLVPGFGREWNAGAAVAVLYLPALFLIFARKEAHAVQEPATALT